MKKLHYIDSHAHLFYANYSQDFDEVLLRAQDSGVRSIIVPGTDLKTSLEAIQLAEKHTCIYACVGIHPHEAAKAISEEFLSLEELSHHPKVVAIGEIGLDYYYDFSPRERQLEVFTLQMDMAVRRNLPVVIHTRESTSDVFSVVKDYVSRNQQWRPGTVYPQRGVFHCFPGTAEEAEYVFGLGFFVSYPGIVTFKKSESLEVVRHIGIEKILLETDSPYMTPVPLRGKRNEPANIVHICRKIAEALNLSEYDVAKKTTENSNRLFDLKV